MAAIPVVIQRIVKYFSVTGSGTKDDPYVLDVNGGGAGGGGGTQYTEADTDSTITGTAIMWEDTGDTLRAVSAAKPLPVSGTFYQTTQPISAASLPLPTGAATAAKQDTGNTSLSSLDTKLGEVQASPTANTVLDRLKAIATALAGTLTVATHAVTQSGTWTVQPGNTANTTAWLIKAQRASTGTTTSVAGSASNGTLLASNSNRLGATIYNDSTAVLYVKLGATASSTSYTVQLAANGGYYEVPANYTGIIDGIWASATGNARITELS